MYWLLYWFLVRSGLGAVEGRFSCVPMVSRRLGPVSAIGKFRVHPNFFHRFNTITVPNNIGFAVRARKTASYRLLLFRHGTRRPCTIVPFPRDCEVNFYCSVVIFSLSVRRFRCTCQLSNPCSRGGKLHFSGGGVLLSPCTHTIAKRDR